MKNSESITINITYEDESKPGEIIRKNLTRQIDVIANGKKVFTEKQNIRHPYFKTHSGIAGAVNLLEDLIAGKTDARFLNDEHTLSQVAQRSLIQSWEKHAKRINLMTDDNRKLKRKKEVTETLSQILAAARNPF